MRRLRLVLEYDGTDFSGFQRQAHRKTVQGALEARLRTVLGHPVEVTAAGRTDAGVHATGQVVHFDTNVRIPADRLEYALQYRTGPDLRIRHVQDVDESFHARFGAVARTYHYLISPERPSPVMGRYVAWASGLLPEALERMRAAVPAVVGTHDFGAFCAAGADVHTTVRTVTRAQVVPVGPLLRLEISADAFLWRMVRSIAGELIEIGRGRRNPERLKQALVGRARTAISVSAPPSGLFLVKVDYPDGYPGSGEDAVGPVTDWQKFCFMR